MSKETNSQFLLNSVRKLDKINDIEFNLDGKLEDVIKNPVEWAEEQANRALSENVDKYPEAKELGESFWDGIKNKD